LFFLIIIGSIACLASVAYSWDLPASFDVIEIKFNHNTSSTSSDGINLFDSEGYSNITASEWKYYLGDNWNKKFGYIKNTSPVVKAKFFCDEGDKDFDEVTIETFRTVGEHDWALDETTVTFQDSLTTDTSFNADALPSSVGKRTIGWSWRITKVDTSSQSPAKVLGGTTHTYYTVLSSPTAPMIYDTWYTGAWTEVLDKSCAWASGETTDSGAASEITEGLYDIDDQDGDIDYHWDIGACQYTVGISPYGEFKLSSFLDSLSISSGVMVNCSDMANLVAIFTAAIGTSTGTKIIDGSGSPNSIDLIGDVPSGWQTPNWAGYHQYGWLSNRVYDAVLKVNQGSPILPTNMTQYTYNTYLGYSYSDSTIVNSVSLDD